MKSFKTLLRDITPYGLVNLRRKILFPPLSNSSVEDRAILHRERQRQIESVTRNQSRREGQNPKYINATNRDEVFGFLTRRGIPLNHLNEGSIPTESLHFISNQIRSLTSTSSPLIGLHIGNFVGVSLAFISESLRRIDPKSITIGIDPNIPHRGVANPQSHASSLLSACNLQNNTILIAGYSRHKSISNDGVVFDNYDPAKGFPDEAACEETLLNLRQFIPTRVHVALIDGNHEGQYLEQELNQIIPLMQTGGIIVLDDVDNHWSEIKAVFESIRDFGLEPVGCDGRVGIARCTRLANCRIFQERGI